MTINSVSSSTQTYSLPQDHQLFQKLIIENIFSNLDWPDVLAFNCVCKAWKILPPGSVFGQKMWKLYFGLQLTDAPPIPSLNSCDLTDKFVVLIPGNISVSILNRPLMGHRIKVKEFEKHAPPKNTCWLVFSKAIIEQHQHSSYDDFKRLAIERNSSIPTPIESLCARVIHYLVTKNPLHQGASICSGVYFPVVEDWEESYGFHAVTLFDEKDEPTIGSFMIDWPMNVGLLSVSKVDCSTTSN